MNTIFGIVYKNERKFSDEMLTNLCTSLEYWDPDSINTYTNDHIVFTNLLLIKSYESKSEHKSGFMAESNCYINSDSRLDYREDLVSELGEDWEEFKDYPDNYIILKTFLKWGVNCVDHLFGDFAFAIWNEDNKQLFCARDHFGARPFYYYDHKDYFIYSSDVLVFNSIPGVSLKIRDRMIIDSICIVLPDQQLSAYSHIKRLEPSSVLKYNQDEPISLLKYWNLSIKDEFTHLNEEQAISGLRNRFLTSIRSKCRTNCLLGIELSGGLDSSSIASSLSRSNAQLSEPLIAFMHTVSLYQKNTPQVSLNMLDRCNEVYENSTIDKLVRISGEGKNGFLDSIQNYLELNMKPIVQDYSLMSDLLYDSCQELNVGVLLSGYGGDEGVTHKPSGYLSELSYLKKRRELKNALIAKMEIERNRNYWFLLKQYIKIYAPSLVRFIKEINPQYKHVLKDRYKIFALAKSFHKDPANRKRFLNKARLPNDPILRHRQYKLLNYGHISDRLENSYYLARKRKIEYRYPFLDVKLIEFFYSLPTEFKYKEGERRYLFRQAMDGILIDSIRKNPSKVGISIPNAVYRIIKDEKEIIRIINEGRLENSFHYVDYDRLVWMVTQMKDVNFREKKLFPPIMFISPFSVLILQKWQREGKIDIGIKC